MNHVRVVVHIELGLDDYREADAAAHVAEWLDEGSSLMTDDFCAAYIERTERIELDCPVHHAPEADEDRQHREED
jgi:hypothetical protein